MTTTRIIIFAGILSVYSVMTTAYQPVVDGTKKIEQNRGAESPLERLKRALALNGLKLDKVEVAALVWRPATSVETPGYGSHAEHDVLPDDSFELAALLSGSYAVYAQGEVASDAINVQLTDTSSQRKLVNVTVHSDTRAAFALNAPCVCKVTASPIISEGRALNTQYTIAIALSHQPRVRK